jgi:hypothetical protein
MLNVVLQLYFDPIEMKFYAKTCIVVQLQNVKRKAHTGGDRDYLGKYRLDTATPIQARERQLA